MKKGTEITGRVERVDFPNKGIVVTEEGTCVVKHVLPGQLVRCMVQKVRKGKAEGRLLEVLEECPEHRESPCPHFGTCGGCNYLSLPIEEELKIKENQVRRLLEPVLQQQEENWEFESIKESPVAYGYRNKMEFSFGDEVKDGPLALGMHKRGSFYDIVTVDKCQIVDQDYRDILTCVLDYCKAQNWSFYHRLRHEGFLRHLMIRKSYFEKEILVVLVTSSALNPDMTEMVNRLISLSLEGTIAGIVHIINDSVADVIKSDETRVLYGRDFIWEQILGLRFKISPFSFFQTNSASAEVLYQVARDYCNVTSGKPVIFDLYSGTGTIAQLMAPVAEKVIGVEIVEEAVEAARVNAKANGLGNCEFIAGDVLKVLDTIEEKPDLIILDPPRDGIHPKALDKIINYQVDRIVYISCKPTSLARDLEILLQRGYRVEKVCPVNQFPWTSNVETVVLLGREKVDGYIDIDLDVEKLVGKSGTAIYKELSEYV